MVVLIGLEEAVDGRLYQVFSAAYLARRRLVDVLKQRTNTYFSSPRLIKIALLALCLLAYVVFHRYRLSMPYGFWRSSLPSLLLIPVMFCVTDLFPSIRFHGWIKKAAITGVATLAAVLWFESVVPVFYFRSVSDPSDMAAMALGWLLYLAVDRVGMLACGQTDHARDNLFGKE